MSINYKAIHHPNVTLDGHITITRMQDVARAEKWAFKIIDNTPVLERYWNMSRRYWNMSRRYNYWDVRFEYDRRAVPSNSRSWNWRKIIPLSKVPMPRDVLSELYAQAL